MWIEASKLYHWLNGGEGAATIVVAIIALVGAIASVVTSYIVAGRSVYISSITVERSKWIDKLRTNLADYSGALSSVLLKTQTVYLTKGGDITARALEVRSELENLGRIAATIQLQVNPWGEIDKNIFAIINMIVVRRTTSSTLIDHADKLLIAHAQWLLKAEWEKVKFEARSPIYRLTHFYAAWCRSRAYRKWVEGDGSITELQQKFKMEREKPIGG